MDQELYRVPPRGGLVEPWLCAQEWLADLGDVLVGS